MATKLFLSLSLLLTLLYSNLALAAPTASSPAAAATTTKAYQIRGVADPIYHLYLQTLPGDATKPVLGPEASAETYIVGSTIQSTNTSAYLNIDTSSASYKPLSLGETSNTTAWGLEGDTIVTTAGSVYGRQTNFLVCVLDTSNTTDTYYEIYLQTGSDVPSGKNCSNYQTLHLPCLC
ncbi:hypothetical protein VTN77DRAFT_4017 [Rasamsonia byssochlamydoides]|uniref:uncharacterized protein n=1 Tax=Rasamsonia byssochlamydoides TaxID=89139 RepID=UPI0037441B1B